MTSVVQIYNMALGNIGSKARVDSPSEPSPEAQACTLYYATCRDTVLAAHPWGFSTKVANLALTSEDPLDTKWGYEYAYPADCLKMFRLLPEVTPSEPVPYVRRVSSDDSKVIWTNLEEAIGEYALAITDTSFFTPEFVWVLSWKLGAAIAMKIRGDANIKQMAEQQYTIELIKARGSNLSEQHETREVDSEFIRGRV